MNATQTSQNLLTNVEQFLDESKCKNSPQLRWARTANARRAIAVLERQLPPVAEEVKPHLRLMFAVLSQAIMDLIVPEFGDTYRPDGMPHKLNKRARFFFQNGAHAEVCELIGLDPDFVTDVLKKLQLLPEAVWRNESASTAA